MEIPDRVAKLLRDGFAEDAIALIRQTYLKKSAYLACPRCEGRMRKDNITGICSKCQQNTASNSNYRGKKMVKSKKKTRGLS